MWIPFPRSLYLKAHLRYHLKFPMEIKIPGLKKISGTQEKTIKLGHDRKIPLDKVAAWIKVKIYLQPKSIYANGCGGPDNLGRIPLRIGHFQARARQLTS
jgi:hypothetical protein